MASSSPYQELKYTSNILAKAKKEDYMAAGRAMQAKIPATLGCDDAVTALDKFMQEEYPQSEDSDLEIKLADDGKANREVITCYKDVPSLEKVIGDKRAVRMKSLMRKEVSVWDRVPVPQLEAGHSPSEHRAPDESLGIPSISDMIGQDIIRCKKEARYYRNRASAVLSENEALKARIRGLETVNLKMAKALGDHGVDLVGAEKKAFKAKLDNLNSRIVKLEMEKEHRRNGTTVRQEPVIPSYGSGNDGHHSSEASGALAADESDDSWTDGGLTPALSDSAIHSGEEPV